MSEARCPRCNEAIRLPEPLPAADASGQCPWCRETFTLHELTDQLPPMLQIVDPGSGTAAMAASAGQLDFDEDSSQTLMDEDEDQAFMLRDEEPPAPAKLAAPPLHAAPRRQKKSSPVKTVLQIVGGGLVSIPLAIAILLLLKYLGVANPNLGFWPLDGSPNRQTTVTQPHPVAENDRPAEPEQGGRLLGEDMPEFGDFDPSDAFDPMREDSDENDAGEDPFAPADGSPTDRPETDGSEPQSEPADAESDQPEEMTILPDTDSLEPDASPDAMLGAEETDDLLSIPPADVASPLSSSTGEEVANSSEQPDADIGAAVASAKEASIALANYSDPTTRSTLLKDLYLELAKLGARASPVNEADYADLFDQLRREDQLETMGKFGKPWFSAPTRLHEGVFATGTIESQGDEYLFSWEEGGSVPISGWDSNLADPSDFVGKKVALLAKIDTAVDPRRLLIGYLERLDRDSEDAEP